MKKKKGQEDRGEVFTPAVYNTRFIHYDNDGNVLSLSGIKDESKNWFEINNDLVTDFMNFKLDPTKYKINYFFNLAKGIIEKDETRLKLINNLYLIPATTNYSNEITLEHNKSWNLILRQDLIDFNVKGKLFFYICKKNNPNFLYRILMFDLSKLSSIEYVDDVETNIKNISILTEQKFNSYGVKEIT